MKTKRFYAAQVILLLENDFPNIDFKIDERQVFFLIDEVVNQLAKENFFENWKLTGAGVDEQYITTFSPITVTDQADGKPSYMDLPQNYAALPWNSGINEIYPLKYTSTNQPSVVVMSHVDFRRYMNNPARGMGGRLYGYLEGNRLIFGTCEVAKKNGANFAARLVVRDSSAIAEDAFYPLPADKEKFVIEECVKLLTIKRSQETDRVRDNNDQAAA